MKIVVLDGYALNPGDLSWGDFEALGELTVHDRTGPDRVVERSESAGALLTNKTPLPREALERLPDLRYIGVLATGYNIIDVAFASEAGISVTNVPTYGTESVAQFVFALLFELVRRVGHHSGEVARGRWAASPDFCFWDYPQIELSGKTLGIVGLGRIGRAAARIGDALGMRVLAHGRSTAEGLDYPGFAWRGLDELLAESDVVSLHCPLTPSTERMIDGRALALMKPGAYLINTSRGGLVVERDLAEALDRGALAGAALDVLPQEPPAVDSPLNRSKKVIITPHIAWATNEARGRLMKTAAENLRAFLAGAPRNLVAG